MSLYKYNLSFITILLCLFHFHAQSQTIQWTDNPGKTFVFEINNDEAEKLIQSAAKESLFLKMLHRPAGSFSGEWKDCPKQGHFIFADINRNNVNYRYVPIMPFQVFLNIYVIEYDFEPVYFSWTEQPKTYSFAVSGSTHRITLRLHDRLLVMDSSVLTAGIPVTLTAKVKVKQKNAEYVMIEIPIPAGCSYDAKITGSYKNYEIHREYFKEKTVIFCEKLPEGAYQYEIRLLPRYSGS